MFLFLDADVKMKTVQFTGVAGGIAIEGCI